MKVHVKTKKDLEVLQNLELDNAADWWNRIELANDYIVETNKFYRENGRQWGQKAGVNTGDGKLEARIPAHLLTVLMQHEPDLLTDNKTWDRFIKAHPEFKV